MGTIAGASARLLLGRERDHQDAGLVGTVVLALVGAVIGGLLGNLATGARELSPAGIVGSIVGAVAVLVAYRAALGRRAV